jgi:undecaprenyl diphosphate synthase
MNARIISKRKGNCGKHIRPILPIFAAPMKTTENLKIPQHVAIIMDGNGRWATQKGENRLFGHMTGVEAVRNALTAASEMGVKYLTLYAFSTENWNRPAAEVEGLMNLLVDTITSEIVDLDKNEVRLAAIGDLENLPASCRNTLNEAISKTSKNNRIQLTLALSYSARWEITRASKIIAQKVKNGEINVEDINEEMISSNLETRNMPDPELLIRTSGEHRISNYLLWQLAYAEFIFLPIMWPEFKKEHFIAAVEEFSKRERRFGLVSEQIQQ